MQKEYNKEGQKGGGETRRNGKERIRRCGYVERRGRRKGKGREGKGWRDRGKGQWGHEKGVGGKKTKGGGVWL